MNHAINSRNPIEAEKWVTRNAEEYGRRFESVAENESTSNILPPIYQKIKNATTLTPSGTVEVAAQSKLIQEQLSRRRETVMRYMQGEQERLNYYWYQKNWRIGALIKDHGIGFLYVWVFFYALGFLGFLFLLETKTIDKRQLFEVVFLACGQTADREDFFKRAATWDRYVNVGCAFLANEAVDLFRIPLTVMFFIAGRRLVTRSKSSMFRWHATEK